MFKFVLVLCATLVILSALFVLVLPLLIKPAMKLMLGFHYRIRLVDAENLPCEGPVLVVCNHVTWIDAFILAAAAPRPFWYLTNANYIDIPIIRSLARRSRMIPVAASGPKSQRRAIEEARKALDQGLAVAIFPEAQLTRNGRLGTFHRGLELILRDRPNIAVAPVYLDNLWGSVFSFSHGRFLGRFSEVKRRRVTIVFGKPIAQPVTAYSAFEAVLEASVRAYSLREGNERRVEAFTPDGSRWEHPELGLLAVSSPNYSKDGITQKGEKDGTVGQAAPGVAIRAASEDGRMLGPGETGRLQVMTEKTNAWVDAGKRGSVDNEGFVKLETS
jgi:1-acyl-sn-glycerol-3-phosphate acyltransferase